MSIQFPVQIQTFNRKLKHYYVTGILIEPGCYIDRQGRQVCFSPTEKYEVADVVPIYYEHGGPIVGFATRFYTTNNKLCFDGYVFDPVIQEILQSGKPGVSAELIRVPGKFIITGIALTKQPAIKNAYLSGVIAMSSLRTELAKFLEDNGIENAEKIATLVEKFLAQFKYPSPELKQYEVKLSEAAKTIEDLTKQIEELKAQNEELLRQIEELKREIDELQRQLEQKTRAYNELQQKYRNLENEYRRREYERRARELENEIRKRVPNFDFTRLPKNLEERIRTLEMLLDVLRKIIKLSEDEDNDKDDNKDKPKPETKKCQKLEFSAPDYSGNVSSTSIDNWDAAIEIYLNKNKK